MKQDEPRQQSTFDEARDLFEQMSGEARRRVEADRLEARNRSSFVKILRALALISVLAAIFALGYGFYNFPDAPIRQKNGAYAGKQGQPRTREDFERFNLWEKILITSGGAAVLFCFAFAVADVREKRRRKSG